MSSMRRILSSRANGAKSPGPVTPEAKARSSQYALRHGLLAKCVVLENESAENFQVVLEDHIRRFAPVDGVELALVEELAAACWRLRRAWVVETENMEAAMASPLAGSERSRIARAFNDLAAQPQGDLMHRYETRLHTMYQRALHNFLMLRAALPPPAGPAIPNEPSPTTGHLPTTGDGTTARPHDCTTAHVVARSPSRRRALVQGCATQK